jgi:hypothetical protein
MSFLAFSELRARNYGRLRATRLVFAHLFTVEPGRNDATSVVQPAIVDLNADHVSDHLIRDMSRDACSYEDVTCTLGVGEVFSSVYYLH